MTDQPRLLSQLASAVAKAPESDPLTWRVCRATRDVLGVDGASITLETSTPDRLTLCATDDRSRQLENLQDVLGEGPCRDAFEQDVPVRARLDQMSAKLWPRFVPAASDVVGAGGVLWSVPMRSGLLVIGSLSMYATRDRELTESPESVQFLADTVAVTLQHDPLSASTPGDVRDWGSRALIHQATGMLIGQLGVSADDALAIMRAYAFAHSVQLTDLAREILARKVDLSGT